MADNTVIKKEEALGISLGKLTQKELLCLVRRLCEIAVKEHGDNGFRGGFRPGNIYISDGKVSVGPADKAGEDGWTKDELEYMSPEVFWNGKKTEKADVYSIGLVLYVGLNCGNVPFVPMADYKPTPEMRANALRTRMNGEPVILPDSVDERLRGICHKALAFDAEERFEDAGEFLKALLEYSAEDCRLGKESEEKKPAAQPKPKTESQPKAAAKPEAESAAKPEPKPDNKPPEGIPQKRLTRYERQSLRLKTVTLIIIALLLCAVGAASELCEPADISISSWLEAKPTPTVSIDPTPSETLEPTPATTPTPTLAPTPTPPAEPIYDLIVEDVSWDKAEMNCREMGGHLVTVGSAEDLQKICDILNKSENSYIKYCWIGCYRNNNDVLTWVSGEAVDYYAWAEGEPSETDAYDGANEDYLMLVRQADGSWLCNDMRMDPFAEYAAFYSGQTAYICQH